MTLFCGVRQNCPHRFQRPSVHDVNNVNNVHQGSSAFVPDPGADLDEICLTGETHLYTLPYTQDVITVGSTLCVMKGYGPSAGKTLWIRVVPQP